MSVLTLEFGRPLNTVEFQSNETQTRTRAPAFAKLERRDWTIHFRLLHCWLCGSLGMPFQRCEESFKSYCHDKSPRVRTLCARIIGELYEDAVPYYSTLERYADDPNDSVQMASRRAIVSLGDSTGKLVKIIATDFLSSNATRQMHAVYASRNLKSSMIYGINELFEASLSEDLPHMVSEAARLKLAELGNMYAPWRVYIVKRAIKVFRNAPKIRRLIRHESLVLAIIQPLLWKLIKDGIEIELLEECSREFTLEFLLDSKGEYRHGVLEIVEAIEALRPD